MYYVPFYPLSNISKMLVATFDKTHFQISSRTIDAQAFNISMNIRKHTAGEIQLIYRFECANDYAFQTTRLEQPIMS